MVYLCIVGILLFLWVLNFFIVIPISKKTRLNSEPSNDAVENGNGVFYCLFILGGIAIADFWLDFLKWVVVVVSSIFFITQLIRFLIWLITNIALTIYEKQGAPKWGFTLVSILLLLVANAITVLTCLKINFGLI